MLFLLRRPAPPLDAYVESLWLCRAPHGARTLELVLPTGAPQLIVNLAEDQTRAYERRADGFHCRISPGSILTGVTTTSQIIRRAGACRRRGLSPGRCSRDRRSYADSIRRAS